MPHSPTVGFAEQFLVSGAPSNLFNFNKSLTGSKQRMSICVCGRVGVLCCWHWQGKLRKRPEKREGDDPIKASNALLG